MQQTLRTLDGPDNLPPYTSWGRIDQVKLELAQIAEVRPALHDNNVPLVLLGTQHRMGDIVAIPGGDSVRDIVQVIVPAKDDVDTMCGRNGVVFLGGRRQCVECFGEGYVLWPSS